MLVNWILRDSIKVYEIYFGGGEITIIDLDEYVNKVQNYAFIDKNDLNILLNSSCIYYKNISEHSIKKFISALKDDFGFVCKDIKEYDMMIEDIQLLYEIYGFILLKGDDL